MEMCTGFEKERGHRVLFQSQCPQSHHRFYSFWLPCGAEQGKLGEKKEWSLPLYAAAEIGMASVPSTICLRWGLERTDSWKHPLLRSPAPALRTCLCQDSCSPVTGERQQSPVWLPGVTSVCQCSACLTQSGLFGLFEGLSGEGSCRAVPSKNPPPGRSQG